MIELGSGYHASRCDHFFQRFVSYEHAKEAAALTNSEFLIHRYKRELVF